MSGRTFGDGRPIEGEAVDEPCPKCGSDMVRKDVPRTFGGGKGRHSVRCTNRECGWKEERAERDDD